jgi:ESCRT-II complex subunit VPS22
MQERTGGLVYLDQLLERIMKVRNRFVNEVSIDDCKRAIKKLDLFGNAFTLIPMNNGRFMVQSVPEGMNVDHTQILKLAENNNGIVTQKHVLEELKWDMFRIDNVFNFLVKEGIVWVDFYNIGTATKYSYYFPSLYN